MYESVVVRERYVHDTSRRTEQGKYKMTAAAKSLADDFIERNREAAALLNDSIFYFGELGMQEFRTCELMSSLLEDSGFEVELNIGGFPTAFFATYGSGSPVITTHTEFDANPDNSQAPGIAEQRAIVEGAPGHVKGTIQMVPFSSQRRLRSSRP